MYLIKSVTFNFARRLRLILGILIDTVKDIFKVFLYPLSLPLKLLLKRSKRRKFKRYKPSQSRKYNYTKGVAYSKHQRRYTDVIISEKVNDNPDDKSGLNHKHDNYQSQIDNINTVIKDIKLSINTDHWYAKSALDGGKDTKLSEKIDMLARKINELFLTDEAYNKQFNRLEKRVEQLSSRINNQLELINDNEVESFQRVNKLEKLVDKKLISTKLNGHVLTLREKVEDIERNINSINNAIFYNAPMEPRFNKLEAKVDKLLSENSELTFKPLTKEEEASLDDLQAKLEIAKGEAIWDDRTRDYPSEPDFQAEQKAMAKQMAKVVERDEA